MGIHKKSPRSGLARRFMEFISSDKSQVDLAVGSSAAGGADPEDSD
jgi:hypothetical protein